MAIPSLKVESKEAVLRSKGARKKVSTKETALQSKSIGKKVQKTQNRGGFARGKVVARGPLARFLVFSGRRFKTTGSLTRKDLMKNKRNRIVSKKAHAWGIKMYHHIRSWVSAHLEARGILKAAGFVALNGKTALGKQLFIKTRALYAERTGKPEMKAEGRASIPFYFAGAKAVWKEDPAEEANAPTVEEGVTHAEQAATAKSIPVVEESKAFPPEDKFPPLSLPSLTVPAQAEPEVARPGDVTPEGMFWLRKP